MVKSVPVRFGVLRDFFRMNYLRKFPVYIFRKHVSGILCVRCFLAETYIRYKVYIRNNAQSFLLPYRINPLEIPRIEPVIINRPEKFQPVLLHFFVGKYIFNLFFGFEFPETFYLHIIVLPCSAPGCPAPHVAEFRKVITLFSSFFSVLEVRRSDMHYALVVPVFSEHFPGKCEKRILEYAVIFYYNAFFNIFKEPVNAFHDAFLAPEIFIAEILIHLAVPVNLFDNLSRRFAFFFLAGFICTRTVCRYEEFFGFYLPYNFKNLFGRIRTVEYQKEYWRVKSGVQLFFSNNKIVPFEKMSINSFSKKIVIILF